MMMCHLGRHAPTEALKLAICQVLAQQIELQLLLEAPSLIGALQDQLSFL